MFDLTWGGRSFCGMPQWEWPKYVFFTGILLNSMEEVERTWQPCSLSLVTSIDFFLNFLMLKLTAVSITKPKTYYTRVNSVSGSHLNNKRVSSLTGNPSQLTTNCSQKIFGSVDWGTIHPGYTVFSQQEQNKAAQVMQNKPNRVVSHWKAVRLNMNLLPLFPALGF